LVNQNSPRRHKGCPSPCRGYKTEKKKKKKKKKTKTQKKKKQKKGRSRAKNSTTTWSLCPFHQR